MSAWQFRASLNGITYGDACPDSRAEHSGTAEEARGLVRTRPGPAQGGDRDRSGSPGKARASRSVVGVSDASPSTERQIRWTVVVLCSVAGAIFWGGAFFTEAEYGWTGAFPDWMLHVGTAIGLAGVLFLLEQRFTRSVTAATGQLVQAAEHRFESRAQELTTRLDQLDEEFRAGLAARADEQDAVLDDLEADVSFGTVTAALETANELRALAEGIATVQGSVDPDELAVEFRWFTTSWPPTREAEFRPQLTVAALVAADFYLRGARPVLQVSWQQGQSASDVGIALAEAIQRGGRWRSSGTLDWQETIRSLIRSLEVAIRSTRRDPGAWHLGGALIELVGDDWALSEAGIEHRHRGLVVSESDFPDGLFQRGETPSDWTPDRPDWVAQLDWDRLIRRAKRRFPRNHGPYRTAPTSIPMTTRLRRAMESGSPLPGH